MPNRNMLSNREPQAMNQPVWAPLASFRRELDRLFDDFLLPGESRVFGTAPLQPRIEIEENDKSYMVTAELPGMDQKDIQVDLKNDILVISGEKRCEKSENGPKRHYTERTYGRFERQIPLDGDIDSAKIEARFDNGVLSVTLPKAPESQSKTRHIDIKTH